VSLFGNRKAFSNIVSIMESVSALGRRSESAGQIPGTRYMKRPYPEDKDKVAKKVVM